MYSIVWRREYILTPYTPPRYRERERTPLPIKGGPADVGIVLAGAVCVAVCVLQWVCCSGCCRVCCSAVGVAVGIAREQERMPLLLKGGLADVGIVLAGAVCVVVWVLQCGCCSRCCRVCCSAVGVAVGIIGIVLADVVCVTVCALQGVLQCGAVYVARE